MRKTVFTNTYLLATQIFDIKTNFMKTKTIGFILIILGIIMMVYTGFNYVTTEKIVDLGPIQINQEKNHKVKWPSILGGVLLAGGIAIIVLDKKKSA